MRRFSFRRGLRFLRQQRAWVVIRRLKNGSIQLEAEDGELWNVRETEILRQCSVGDLVVDLENSPRQSPPVLVTRDLSTFPEIVQERSRRRLAYVQRLQELGPITFTPAALKPLIRQVAIELEDPQPPSPTSIYRWYQRYSIGSSIVDLADRWELKGRTSSWPQEVQEIVRVAVDTIFLNEQRHWRKEACEAVALKVIQLNASRPPEQRITPPSRSTLYRYMASLEDFEVMKARYGKAFAERRYRMVLGTQTAHRLLERVEIDHTPLDVLVFCDRSKLPLGKPWLTAALDKYSRMIIGFYISFSTPSAHSVLACLTQAILPKDELLKQYPDITTPWPARGLFEVLVCDNGMELHSKALSNACEELSVQLQFCPAKVPEYKGSVERFLKTANHDLIHRLPGTVFSGVKERGEYESETRACITFDTLLYLVTKWTVEIYSQETHRGIGTSPSLMWARGECERVLEFPAEPTQLGTILAHSATRRVFRYGVQLNCLRYNNPELQLLRQRYGENSHVDLKHGEDDVGKIHVFDPDQKAYFEVPAINQDYAAGLRLIQHEIICEDLRRQNQDPARVTALLIKKQELQDAIDAATYSRRMATRKRRAVVEGIDSTPRPTSKQRASRTPKDLITLPSPADGPIPTFKTTNRTRPDGEGQ